MSKLIRFLYLFLFFFTPLIFTSTNSELFELPKMYFLYTSTLIIVTIHLYNYFRGSTPLYQPSPLNLPLSIFLLSQVISTIFSIDVHTSIFGYYSRLNGGLLSLFSYCLLYWILLVYLDEKFKNYLINTFLLSGFLVAFYGILEHFGIDKNLWVQDVQNRVFSTLGQPNWLAAYLAILLPFAFNKYLKSSSWIYQLLSAILTVSLYLALLFTKSKSGILAAIIGLIIFSLYFFIKKNRRHYISLLLPIILITISIIINNPIKDYLYPSKNQSAAPVNSTINITPSGDIRKIVWAGAIKLWQQFPIFGTGPETFAYSYYWTRPASHNLTSEWDFIYNKAHNEYLNYLSTTGTLGLLAYLFVIFIIIRQLFNISHDSDKYAAISAFVTILITNFAGFSTVIIALFFFTLPALLFNPSVPYLSKPKPKLLFLPFFLISIYLLIKIIHFYIADLAYAQASTLNLDNQSNQALPLIRLSLHYRPNEPVYLIESANIEAKLALNAQNQKQTDKSFEFAHNAMAAVSRATNISPFSLNLWKESAQVYYYLSAIDPKQYLQAISALDKATKLAPTDAKSFYLLAQFYQNISQNDEAIINYQKAIELKANYDHALLALAKLYFDQKKYDQATINFEKTLQIAPNSTEAQKYLSLIATMSAKKP